jgi:hypothetical protein
MDFFDVEDERKTKAEIEAERLKDLELGFYYCLVESESVINETDSEIYFEIKETLEVRELKYSYISEVKYFSPRTGFEEIIYFERINQKPTFTSKPIRIVKHDKNTVE